MTNTTAFQLALLLVSLVGLATAFLPPFPDATSRTTRNLFKVSQETSTTRQSVVTTFTPHPPDTSPPENLLQEELPEVAAVEEPQSTPPPEPQQDGTTRVVVSKLSLAPPPVQAQLDSLLDQMWDQEQLVQEKRQLVRGLTSVLHEKKQKLLEYEDAVQEEAQLKAQLEQLQRDLQSARDNESLTEQDHQIRVAELEAIEDQLQAQVGALQQELVRLGHQLRAEKERSNSLTQRLLEVEGTTDWEEEEFQKDKERLLRDLQWQQTQMEELSAKWKAEEVEQEQDLTILRAKLNTTLENLQQELLRLELQRLDHQTERTNLQESIQSEQQEIQKAKEDLKEYQDSTTETLELLKREVEQKQQEYQKLQQAVALEKIELAKLELQLEDQFLQANQTIDQKTYQLQKVTSRNQGEAGFLKDRLQAEAKQLQLVETELRKEILTNDQLRAAWEAKITAKSQRTQSVLQTMSRRFASLRSVLTGRTRTAQKEGRQLEKALIQRYNANVQELQSAFELLLDSVTTSRDYTRRLQEQIQVESKMFQEAKASQRDIDVTMVRNLDKADKEVYRLRKDRSDLIQELERRTAEADKIQYSFRAIARASWQLTKEKARRARGKLLKVFFASFPSSV